MAAVTNKELSTRRSITRLIGGGSYVKRLANYWTFPRPWPSVHRRGSQGRTPRMTKAVLPYFRERASGHVIRISSIGGRVGPTGRAAYAAAKFGVEGFSERRVLRGGPGVASPLVHQIFL